ncbi:MAG: TRAP transporter small permease [Bacillota bacterium]|nr:TRAP transporter small permease [Bacillota bacterium]MDW7729623.1 TRAP transporter small permease [Bacillota bacterium]
MPFFETAVVKTSRGLDVLAGLILAGTALLVVANIIGRTLLNYSILGTYEMVGFLTAAAVGLSLARCAVENSHIAIEFILERFPQKFQRKVEIVFSIPSILFLGFATYNLFTYGLRIARTGEVSPTTQMIFHPFIYLVAIGFMLLTLVVLLKLIKLISGGEHN